MVDIMQHNLRDSVTIRAITCLAGAMRGIVQGMMEQAHRSILVWNLGMKACNATEGVAEMVMRFSEEQSRLYGVVVEGWSAVSLQRCVMQWFRSAKRDLHNNTRSRLLSLSSSTQMGMVSEGAVLL